MNIIKKEIPFYLPNPFRFLRAKTFMSFMNKFNLRFDFEGYGSFLLFGIKIPYFEYRFVPKNLRIEQALYNSGNLWKEMIPSFVKEIREESYAIRS